MTAEQLVDLIANKANAFLAPFGLNLLQVLPLLVIGMFGSLVIKAFGGAFTKRKY